MRHPWQIWSAFSLCLLAVLAAMLWLSLKTVQLDALRETDRAETEIARQEAELQERISSALYRMDLKLLPLVAGEAARPHFLYQPFYEITNPTLANDTPITPQIAGWEALEAPSPLLFQPPEFVILHFQIGPGNRITSPQLPEGNKLVEQARQLGITQSSIAAAAEKLQLASHIFHYQSLLDRCQEITHPPQIAMAGPQTDTALENNYNVPAAEKISQQIKDNAPQQIAADEQNRGNKVAMQRSRGQGRVNEEFTRRLSSTKELASQQWGNRAYGDPMGQSGIGNQMLQSPAVDTASGVVQQGVMQPMWVDDKLILARRVDGQKQPVIQCCWLDWDEIQTVLKNEVADLLPQVELQPVKADTNLDVGNALTTIPVQLVVDSSKLLSTLAISTGSVKIPASGLRMSLLVAWCGFGLAAFASAFLLHGVMRLSERRAAFVSAVTHELRTPLTTFRMYAEMLAEKMVPAGKQQEYANTLKVQADRLSHLVENVLQFARLERGATSDSRETVAVDAMIDRLSLRLRERAEEAEMELSIDMEDSVSKSSISTQPSTVEQILFNLVDNACKYAKPSVNNRIEIQCRGSGRWLKFCVRDYGPGVSTKFKKTMFQPFCKSDQDAANSAPGVGLGLALGRRMAASLGGRLSHESCDNGALFVLELPR
jgi:signal transduction histidine kinase